MSQKVYTYQTRNFAAQVVQPKTQVNKTLKLTHGRWYQHEINKFKSGEKVTIYITNKRPKRTENQNRYYWGVYLPLIAQETGEHDLERLHELFKGKFLTKEIVEVLGETVRMKGSTTSLSVSDFSDYIANIYQLTGVMPPPSEEFSLPKFHDEVK